MVKIVINLMHFKDVIYDPKHPKDQYFIAGVWRNIAEELNIIGK